jgi:hypothetical protein
MRRLPAPSLFRKERQGGGFLRYTPFRRKHQSGSFAAALQKRVAQFRPPRPVAG